MAAIVVSQTVNRWTGNQKSRAGYMRALEPNNETARKDLETMVLGLPHFEVYGTTDTDTATSTALDLTALGVTFPDATQRIIYVEASVADVDGQGLLILRGIVDGGATPLLADQDLDVSMDDSLAGAVGAFALSVATANVILTAEGQTGVDCRWVIRVWVGDLIPLAYIA